MDTYDVKRQEDMRKIAAMVKDVRIAMLTTVEEDGELRSRPMAMQEVEFDGDLWFFTREHSPKVDEVSKDKAVCVTLSDPRHQRYISLSGDAEPIRDHSKMAQLWKPTYKAWFPDGLADPELGLLKVKVRKAEYWDAPPSKVVQLLGAAKATMTGHEYDAGDHAKLDLEKGYIG